MKLNKPEFWSISNSFISLLLLPISFFIILLISLKKKIIKPIKFNIPIICVGNIYIGGTGKTPTSIFLAQELLKLDKNPVILRKFYKSHIDEHRLIKENFESFITNSDRINGALEAEKLKYDSIILDDGYQDYKIKKDLNIVCFNQNQLIGNGLVIPSGPLRENLSSLINAQIILINGKKDTKFEKKILSINQHLKIFYSNYIPKNIEYFKNKKLIALAAIGNPNNFFNLLEENRLNIEKKLIFPDHYNFSKDEIENINEEAKANNYQIITTEKDYFKIKDFKFENIRYLKVALDISKKNELLKIILKLYDKKN
jgi:tetraacyldisaccharide 4'-kinase